MVVNKLAFDMIKREKDNLLPTAPKATMVLWYDRNMEDREYSALVTEQQGPGKLELVIFKPRGMPMHKQGVLHRSHPVHEKRADSSTIRNGSWDYPQNVKPHRSHFEYHLAEIERREKHLLESERIAKEAEMARNKIHGEVEELEDIKPAK